MIESISTSTCPTEKSTVKYGNHEQESSFLDMLKRENLHTNNSVQSTDSKTSDKKPGLDALVKQEAESIALHAEHPELSPYFKIFDPNSSNQVQRANDELYESKWYAIGRLSYKAVSYHTPTDAEAITRRGKQVFTVLDNTANSRSRPVYSPKLNIENDIDTSLRTQVQRSPEPSTSKQSGSVFQVMASVPEYLRKKITFTENEDVFHVYIRDYSLSEEEKKLLINSVSESHRASNKTLSLLVINGEKFQFNRGANNHAG